MLRILKCAIVHDYLINLSKYYKIVLISEPTLTVQILNLYPSQYLNFEYSDSTRKKAIKK